MKIKQSGNNLIIEEIRCFDLEQTLDCGQAFRWKQSSDGCFQGAAFGKFLKIGEKDGNIILYNTTQQDFDLIWKKYFDLERDYEKIICDIGENEVLRKAADYAKGIRLLSQEPWEALCSFIISQNNNIPRIKGIIERLCDNFGERINEEYCAFPSAQVIAKLTVEDLAPLRCGFRARYILDAAQKVASGEIDLEKLREADTASARETLKKICGVGDKVADCALLFGLSHISAFPKDVWIKRAMEHLFDGELPECALPYAGIVQQYIFHYARTTKLNV